LAFCGTARAISALIFLLFVMVQTGLFHPLFVSRTDLGPLFLVELAVLVGIIFVQHFFLERLLLVGLGLFAFGRRRCDRQRARYTQYSRKQSLHNDFLLLHAVGLNCKHLDEMREPRVTIAAWATPLGPIGVQHLRVRTGAESCASRPDRLTRRLPSPPARLCMVAHTV